MSREKDTEFEEEMENKGMNENNMFDEMPLRIDSPPKTPRIREANRRLVKSSDRFSMSEIMFGDKPQDADYYYFLPSLSDELEALIVARVPRFEYHKFYLLNKRFCSLLKSGELFKIRREIGVTETSVFMSASGDSGWWTFDNDFRVRRKLPDLPSSDPCFKFLDKESFCAGTHLIVSGKEMDGSVIWRYELETNKWFKGPCMIKPRCLFASATCGTYAFVAGGLEVAAGLEAEGEPEVLNLAEKYNPETKSWDRLPRMHQKRKLCSGCYLDNKFYVIGGKNTANKALTCAEAYDEEKRRWELIPDMLKDFPAESSQSPPLIAVVNNELYSLETYSNELRVYLKKSNTWKSLGLAPVRADFHGGWGVAFKSLGNKLLVIGASPGSRESVAIYTCCPNPDSTDLQWRFIGSGSDPLSPFILNCSIMVA